MSVGEVLFGLLAIVGLCDLFRSVIFWIYNDRKEGEIILTLHLSGHREDAEYLIRGALQKLKAARGVSQKRLLVIDDGMDQETRNICEILLQGQPQATICSGKDAPAEVCKMR